MGVTGALCSSSYWEAAAAGLQRMLQNGRVPTRGGDGQDLLNRLQPEAVLSLCMASSSIWQVKGSSVAIGLGLCQTGSVLYPCRVLWNTGTSTPCVTCTEAPSSAALSPQTSYPDVCVVQGQFSLLAFCRAFVCACRRSGWARVSRRT